jgi:hypothetical protein
MRSYLFNNLYKQLERRIVTPGTDSNIKMDSNAQDDVVWTEFIWLRI